MSQRADAFSDGPPRIDAPADGRRVRPLIQADRLSKLFRVERGLLKTPRLVQALDGVSLQVLRGEVVGVVGQTASGKSTLAGLLVRRLEPTFGRLLFDGEDITHAPAGSLATVHRRLQLIPQDHDVAVMRDARLADLLGDPLAAAGVPDDELGPRARALLDELGIDAPLDRYAGELSLGQRQLLVIARSLALEPELCVCDDVLASLDSEAQDRVLGAFEQRRQERGTSFVLLSNDLGVVRRLARRVLVLYAGRVVERGASIRVFGAPLHPYTRVLASTAPDPDADRRRLAVVIEGFLPSPAELPAGCAFHPRCPRSETGRCDVDVPQLSTPGDGAHSVACFHPLESGAIRSDAPRV